MGKLPGIHTKVKNTGKLAVKKDEVKEFLSAKEVKALCGTDKFPICLDLSAQCFSLKLQDFLRRVPADTLKEIDLTSNELTELTLLNNQTKLQKLVADKNWISKISFQNLYSCKHISLCTNNLAAIPDMNDLQSISYLDFSGNRIAAGFENLVVLKTLKYLDLSDNEISFTPKEFLMNIIVPLKCLPKLTYFNFLSNPIENNFPEIRYLIIYSLPKLQYLNGEKITKADRAKAEDLSAEEQFQSIYSGESIQRFNSSDTESEDVFGAFEKYKNAPPVHIFAQNSTQIRETLQKQVDSDTSSGSSDLDEQKEEKEEKPINYFDLLNEMITDSENNNISTDLKVQKTDFGTDSTQSFMSSINPIDERADPEDEEELNSLLSQLVEANKYSASSGINQNHSISTIDSLRSLPDDEEQFFTSLKSMVANYSNPDNYHSNVNNNNNNNNNNNSSSNVHYNSNIGNHGKSNNNVQFSQTSISSKDSMEKRNSKIINSFYFDEDSDEDLLNMNIEKIMSSTNKYNAKNNNNNNNNNSDVDFDLISSPTTSEPTSSRRFTEQIKQTIHNEKSKEAQSLRRLHQELEPSPPIQRTVSNEIDERKKQEDEERRFREEHRKLVEEEKNRELLRQQELRQIEEEQKRELLRRQEKIKREEDERRKNTLKLALQSNQRKNTLPFLSFDDDLEENEPKKKVRVNNQQDSFHSSDSFKQELVKENLKSTQKHSNAVFKKPHPLPSSLQPNLPPPTTQTPTSTLPPTNIATKASSTSPTPVVPVLTRSPTPTVGVAPIPPPKPMKKKPSYTQIPVPSSMNTQVQPHRVHDSSSHGRFKNDQLILLESEILRQLADLQQKQLEIQRRINDKQYQIQLLIMNINNTAPSSNHSRDLYYPLPLGLTPDTSYQPHHQLHIHQHNTSSSHMSNSVYSQMGGINQNPSINSNHSVMSYSSKSGNNTQSADHMLSPNINQNLSVHSERSAVGINQNVSVRSVTSDDEKKPTSNTSYVINQINRMVQILEQDNAELQLKALKALLQFGKIEANILFIIQTNVFEILNQILKGIPNANDQLIENAAYAISSFCHSPLAEKSARECSLNSTLVGLIISPPTPLSDRTTERVIKAISVLAMHKESHIILRSSGVIFPLLNFLDTSDSSLIQARALKTLCIFLDEQNSLEYFLEKDGAEMMEQLLTSSNASTRLSGLIVMCHLKFTNRFDYHFPKYSNVPFFRYVTQFLLADDPSLSLLALIAIENFCKREDMRNEIIGEGCIDELVVLLDPSNESKILKIALSSLSNFTTSQSQLLTFKKANGFQAVIDLLSHSKPEVQFYALHFFHKFINQASINKEIVRAISFIPKCIGLMTSSHPSCQKMSCKIIATLMVNQNCLQVINSSGVLPQVLGLIDHENEDIQEICSSILQKIVEYDRSIRKTLLSSPIVMTKLFKILTNIARKEVKEAIALVITDIYESSEEIFRQVSVWQSLCQILISTKSVVLIEKLLTLITAFVLPADNQTILRECGAFPAILAYLNSEESNIQRLAVKAILGLCRNEENRARLIQENAIEELTKLGRSPQQIYKIASGKCLSFLNAV